MPFFIVQRDITTMGVDAIVNAANRELQMGGGVCGAIFRTAGVKEMREACDAHGAIKTGEAAITPGFALSAKHVIHAVGPIYNAYSPEESGRLLEEVYRSALEIAKREGLQSIAFPLISAGIYGFPRERALKIATSTIRGFLENTEMDVYLALLDRGASITDATLTYAVEAYLRENYDSPQEPHLRSGLRANIHNIDVQSLDSKIYNIEAVQKTPTFDLEASFGQALLDRIDSCGKTDVEVYKRANLDRRLFSKLRSNADYTPSKRTAIALCIALELDLEETDAMLKRAGYALSHSRKFDVIVEYFIIKGNYDIYEINEVLFHYDQPLLGGDF